MECKDQFKLQAKLHYCADIIANTDCVAALDLRTLTILMALQHKVQGVRYEHHPVESIRTSVFNSKEYRFKELQNQPIYNYLRYASIENNPELENDYNNVFNTPIEVLADNMFNRIVKLQYRHDNTIVLPVWEPYDTGKYVRDWDYRFVKNNNITNSTAALELAESYFNDWIDVNVREQDMGKNISF